MLRTQLAEKEKMLALKNEESFGMKDHIDRQRLDNERMKKEV